MNAINSVAFPRRPDLCGERHPSVSVRSGAISSRCVPVRGIIASSLAAWIFLFLTGCATVDKGHDPVVVNAERTQKIAFEAVDMFLALEHENRALYRTKTPALHNLAESFRKRAPQAFRAVNEATKTYKANRGPENKQKLQAALGAVIRLGLEASGALQSLKETKP